MALPPLSVDPDIEQLASKMRELRAASGLTYEQLAERAGMSRRGVIEYEQGRTFGTLRHWHRIAQALNIRFSDLMRVLD